MYLYLLLSLPVLKKAYNILKSRASFFSDKLICQFVCFVEFFHLYCYHNHQVEGGKQESVVTTETVWFIDASQRSITEHSRLSK